MILLTRLGIIMLSMLMAATVGMSVMPMATRWFAQRQVQDVGNALAETVDLASNNVNSGTPGAMLALSSGTQMELSGVPLTAQYVGEASASTIRTYHYSESFGVWMESVGASTWTAESLPLIISVTTGGQLGIVPGAVGTTVATLPLCGHIAIGFPAGTSSPPMNAVQFSCATGQREVLVADP